MTPAARINAAIGILNDVLSGQPAEQALLSWSRKSRFAGSGDRAAIRDLVFEALRRRDSLAALGGGLHGRGLMIGLLRANGTDPATIFTGEGYAPETLSADEVTGGVPAAEATNMHDLPEWLWPQWQASLKEDALSAAHQMRSRAPIWLRVNPHKADPATIRDQLAHQGIETEKAPQSATALRVIEGERRVSGSQAYMEGWVELQDLSPQLACEMLPLSTGIRVLDYCAGGGGKSLALAARVDIEVTAHDIAPDRMKDLPARASRAGVEIKIAPTSPIDKKYDMVVADVPCSGTGTWRRTPDAKWRLKSDDLEAMIETQAQILRETAPLVRSGGHLAYMTCSVLERENEKQADNFLLHHPDFSEIARERWLNPRGSDGFFLSLMQRN
ncbi:RsmB/NOP family class I SAM-dependent RNA methyltransferase [Paracoccus albus]|uniref:RsmB/NOP family class I SAM-dependent RNA methyltransferase n=1 Tax=Paracoccus albus TaxID=3017784 RepID=UPI0022F0F413|nr:RsmB/NOP family class I SAM-dependent RNA methyltransferase [Paracoccus albus]WBU61900.1 RsmB/NOP family class I SAM-dependent RNA methyltransferase [Paracoccus albus]